MDPSRRSLSRVACGRSRPDMRLARGQLPDFGVTRRRCSEHDSPRSVLACTRLGSLGSSCRAGRAPFYATRIRLAASTASSVHSDVFARFQLARTYVRNACGRHLRAMTVESRRHGEWRSLVAHPAGGRAVAGSNPVSPIKERPRNAHLLASPRRVTTVHGEQTGNKILATCISLSGLGTASLRLCAGPYAIELADLAEHPRPKPMNVFAPDLPPNLDSRRPLNRVI